MGNTSGRKPPSVADFLFNEVRQAFQDVRQKLVEEGWFGRVVTAAPVVELGETAKSESRQSHAPEARSREPSFDELWKPRDWTRELDRPQGMDIDR